MSVEQLPGLVDVTATPLDELRTDPGPQQVEQTRRMIDELLVSLPLHQVQVEYDADTARLAD